MRQHYPVTFHRSRLCVSSQPPVGSSRVNSPTIKQTTVKGNRFGKQCGEALSEDTMPLFGKSAPLWSDEPRFKVQNYLPSLSSSRASVITLFFKPGKEMDSLGLCALAFGSSGPVTNT